MREYCPCNRALLSFTFQWAHGVKSLPKVTSHPCYPNPFGIVPLWSLHKSVRVSLTPRKTQNKAVHPYPFYEKVMQILTVTFILVVGKVRSAGNACVLFLYSNSPKLSLPWALPYWRVPCVHRVAPASWGSALIRRGLIPTSGCSLCAGRWKEPCHGQFNVVYSNF